jgi:hypothetical protein
MGGPATRDRDPDVGKSAHDEYGNDLEYRRRSNCKKANGPRPRGHFSPCRCLGCRSRRFLISSPSQLTIPDGMSDLVRAAHRLRAFRALCVAARDGKVKLFGTLRGGARQQINPIEFDQAFRWPMRMAPLAIIVPYKLASASRPPPGLSSVSR